MQDVNVTCFLISIFKGVQLFPTCKGNQWKHWSQPRTRGVSAVAGNPHTWRLGPSCSANRYGFMDIFVCPRKTCFIRHSHNRAIPAQPHAPLTPTSARCRGEFEQLEQLLPAAGYSSLSTSICTSPHALPAHTIRNRRSGGQCWRPPHGWILKKKDKWMSQVKNTAHLSELLAKSNCSLVMLPRKKNWVTWRDFWQRIRAK